ncbi:MAG: hypothetical protein PHX04_02055 [Bacilli bacterium]|nr:hypothetical protein [Bacilli bacterium]
MRKNIIKLILAVFLITYGEHYYYLGLNKLGVNLSDSYLTESIIILIFYVLVFILIYFLYREELSRDFRRFKRNIFPNILMSIVFFVVVTLLIAVANYIGNTLAISFKVNYVGLNNQNIFNESFDIDFVFNLLKNILIIPSIKCIIWVLGISQIISSKNKSIIISGLFGAAIAVISTKTSVIYMLINGIPYFTLYASLAYIYRKYNTNIWFSIISALFYSLFGSVLLIRLFGS